ncbi:uncharacterized protein PG986_008289 [Apiospora aurea]|uniref:Uncharacterized protein n=1 Tax=Apiospora aurea TaxID=335848 RepID=A0ABR1QFR5_9PEZI
MAVERTKTTLLTTLPCIQASGTKYALVAVFVACSAFGGWATIGSLQKTGLGALIEAVLAGNQAAFPGGPEPFKRRWTGLAPVDGFLGGIVGFFSAIIDGSNAPDRSGKVEWDAYLFYVWFAGQFVAVWAMLLLESLRVGNRGRLVSYVGLVGMLFQVGTWTVVGPLYLALHLLTSPVASLNRGDGPRACRALFVLLWDMALLPAVVTLTNTLPAVIMSAPASGDAFLGGGLTASASAHYKAIAFWQFFPLWSVCLQAFLNPLCAFLFGSLLPVDPAGKPAPLGRGYLTGVSGVYQFALTVCVGVHAPLVAVSLAPAAARAWLVAHATSLSVPAAYAGLFETATFRGIFVPASPLAPPTIAVGAVNGGTIAYTGVAQAAAHFLRYDMLVGAVPFLLWAAYLHQTTAKTPLSPFALVRKVAFWAVVGGAYAPAVALLWGRDQVVLEEDEPLRVAAAVRAVAGGGGGTTTTTKKAQ